MKKSNKIRRIIAELLLSFFVFFSLGVLFAFFRDNDIDIPYEMLKAAVFSVFYSITNYMLRKKEAEKPDENADKTQ